jgi:DNA polymerase-3 subunit gamma/tau
MVLIRLLFAADQPPPGDVLKQLKDGTTVSMGAGAASTPSSAQRGSTVMRAVPSGNMAAAVAPQVVTDNGASPVTFQQAVALFGERKEGLLMATIESYVHVVKFEQGHLAVRVKEGAPHNLVGQMSEKLSAWTGRPWIVSLSREAGEPTIAEQRAGQKRQVEDEVRANPVVAEALKTFPGAKIIDIRLKQ